METFNEYYSIYKKSLDYTLPAGVVLGITLALSDRSEDASVKKSAGIVLGSVAFSAVWPITIPYICCVGLKK